MNTRAGRKQTYKSQSVANALSEKSGRDEPAFLPIGIGMADNRPEAFAQRKLQALANNSPRTMQLKALREITGNNPQTKQVSKLQEIADHYSAGRNNPIQGKGIIQRVTNKEKFNVIGEHHSKKHDYVIFFSKKHDLKVNVFGESAFVDYATQEQGDSKTLRLEYLLASFNEEGKKILKKYTDGEKYDFNFYYKIFILLGKLEGEIKNQPVDPGIQSLVSDARKRLTNISDQTDDKRKESLVALGSTIESLEKPPRNSAEVSIARSMHMHKVAQKAADQKYLVWLIGDNHVQDIENKKLHTDYALTSKKEFETELKKLETQEKDPVETQVEKPLDLQDEKLSEDDWETSGL